MMQRNEEFDVLDKLRKSGPLPHQLEQRHQRLRRQSFFKAGLQCDDYPPSTSRLESADMTTADWLKERWSSADDAVRRSLRLLAEALGIPLPLRRTRPIILFDGKDSSPTRRSEFTRHTSHAEQDALDSLAGMDPEFRVDGPQWHDDDADGWTPSESLTEALHDALDPDDRGWS